MKTLIKIFIGTCLCFLFTASTSLDKDYPKSDFIAPVKTAIRLSGTFGELRSNHFHSGIDIKGGIGVPIYAIGEGYISRIKVDGGGYGNVLYMSHPNGFTSVYAHLNEFSPEIAKYVKELQLSSETFELDVNPPVDSFSYEQGELIGKMGTTGYSFGPHLHFEIRDSETDIPVNPLLFGFKVPDRTRPRMHQLRVYELNEAHETINASSVSLYSKSSRYSLRDTIEVSSNNVGFALKVYDHMDGVRNWNGIYELDTYMDDSLIYHFDMEKFGFEEWRYINAHMDYPEQQKNSWFNRCYLLPGNKLSIYESGNGVIDLVNNKSKSIKIIAKDIKGNSSTLSFYVKKKNAKEKTTTNKDYNYFLPYDEESIIENDPLFLHFPKGAFYENVYLKYNIAKESSHNIYSEMHLIHNRFTPVHEFFELGIATNQVPDSLKSKAFIAYCGKNDKIVNCGGKWQGNQLTTKVRNFGDYCIMLDEVAPTVKPSSFRYNLRGRRSMSFKIQDNLPTGGTADELSYTAKVDGKWILMNYDAKNDLIFHRFDGSISKGEHEIEVIVTDDRGNEGVFNSKFVL
ncbi:MAG: M23 family metallopeptidase [Bacteroidota bacterium]